ncbi:TPA: hypothetical protein ACPVZG_004169 [Vibrio parahaemolyticus]
MTNRTVAAKWRENGEPDPHNNEYNEGLDSLTYGHFNDKKLAEIIVDLGHQGLSSIGFRMGAKDRIRWLSRRVVEICPPEKVEEVEMQRNQLPMGDLTDDEMANATINLGDNLKDGKDYLKAGKARILWLSNLYKEMQP